MSPVQTMITPDFRRYLPLGRNGKNTLDVLSGYYNMAVVKEVRVGSSNKRIKVDVEDIKQRASNMLGGHLRAKAEEYPPPSQGFLVEHQQYFYQMYQAHNSTQQQYYSGYIPNTSPSSSSTSDSSETMMQPLQPQQWPQPPQGNSYIQ